MQKERIAFAKLADWEERNRRVQLAIGEQDRFVKEVFKTTKAKVTEGPKPIADGGWDTSYLVQTPHGQIKVIVRAALDRRALEEDIRLQLQSLH